MRTLGIWSGAPLNLEAKQQLIQVEECGQEDERRKGVWRQEEGLPENTPLYRVHDAGLYSLYPADPTHAEMRLVTILLGAFNPHYVLVDSYFEKPDGSTSQIDVIAVNAHGVFVFESKAFSGWILGDGNDLNWTQVLAYGREKYSHYNPIKQNRSHINVLCSHLRDPRIPITSIIVLARGAEIKKMTSVPQGTYVITEYELPALLAELQQGPASLTQQQAWGVIQELRQRLVVPTQAVRERHIAEIHNMLRGTGRGTSSTEPDRRPTEPFIDQERVRPFVQ